MSIVLNSENSTPLYLQIRDELRHRITAGEVTAGSMLPSSRQLASDLNVSRITITNAYDELEAEGLIEGKAGSGIFVLPPQYWAIPAVSASKLAIESFALWQEKLPASRPTRRERLLNMILPYSFKHDSLNFGVGMGDTRLFPIFDVRRIISDTLWKGDFAALDYEDFQGFLPLRQSLTKYLQQQNINVGVEEIFVTAGSQQAIALVVEALLKPGDCVIVEDPTYSVALSLFESKGLNIIGIPMDAEGMKDDILEDAIRNNSPKLIYTVPTFHNPTGIVMSAVRRSRIVQLANQYGIPVLEDDFIRELRFLNPIPPPLAAWDKHGDIIYVGSFSKTLFPAIRLGYIVARGPIRNQLLYLKRVSDLGSSALLQRVLYHFLESGKLQKHWKHLSRIYRRRQSAMIKALKSYFPADSKWQINNGGLMLWVKLSSKISISNLLEASIKSGVCFTPGETHFVEPSDQPFIRLNFAALDENQIEKGISLIGRVIGQQLAQSKKIK